MWVDTKKNGCPLVSAAGPKHEKKTVGKNDRNIFQFCKLIQGMEQICHTYVGLRKKRKRHRKQLKNKTKKRFIFGII